MTTIFVGVKVCLGDSTNYFGYHNDEHIELIGISPVYENVLYRKSVTL
jgi:hypothetical protein